MYYSFINKHYALLALIMTVLSIICVQVETMKVNINIDRNPNRPAANRPAANRRLFLGTATGTATQFFGIQSVRTLFAKDFLQKIESAGG